MTTDYQAREREGGGLANTQYTTILIDNLRVEGWEEPSGIDNFMAQMIESRHILPPKVKVTSLAFYSSGFMTRVEEEKDILAAEIDCAMKLFPKVEREVPFSLKPNSPLGLRPPL